MMYLSQNQVDVISNLYENTRVDPWIVNNLTNIQTLLCRVSVVNFMLDKKLTPDGIVDIV